MKTTVYEHFRLRPGMRIKLREGPAVVERVTACAAVCRLEALCQATGLATSTAYKYFDGGKTPQGDRFKDHLVEKDGLLWWRE